MSKPRKMLNDYNAPYIKRLMELIQTQSKETLAKWAVDYSIDFLLPVYCK